METSYPTVTHEISRPVDEDTPSMYPHDHRGLVDCTNMADGRDQSDPQMITGHLQSPTSAGLDTTYRAPQENDGSDLGGHLKGATRSRLGEKALRSLTYSQLGVPKYQHRKPVVSSI